MWAIATPDIVRERLISPHTGKQEENRLTFWYNLQ
jgi:hypothetical protein